MITSPLAFVRSPFQLAQALKTSPSQIDTVLADRQRHYLPPRFKPRPGKEPRRIDEPHEFLKHLQGKIHSFLLATCRLSPHTHGGRPGHSARQVAENHCGAQILVHIDIANFFPSVTSDKIAAALRYQGASRQVATLLAKLVTRPADAAAYDFLPQGSPSSTTVANIVLTRFDDNFAHYAATSDLRYDRWIDDVIISGDRAREAIRIAIGLIQHEGFPISREKTRVESRGHRQEALGFRVATIVSPSTRFRTSTTTLIMSPTGLPAEDWLTLRRRIQGKVAFARQCEGRYGQQLTRRLTKLDDHVSQKPQTSTGENRRPYEEARDHDDDG